MDPPVSRKPEKATEQEKKKRKRKRMTKQTITRAVTHIRLIEANPGKLAALDALMAVYLPLCQQYTTLFCESETGPGAYSDPVFETAFRPLASRGNASLPQALRKFSHQSRERLSEVPGRCH